MRLFKGKIKNFIWPFLCRLAKRKRDSVMRFVISDLFLDRVPSVPNDRFCYSNFFLPRSFPRL